MANQSCCKCDSRGPRLTQIGSHHPCGASFHATKETPVKGSWNLPLWLQRAAEVWHVAVGSLHGGPEKLSCETMKVKPGLHWRSQDTGNDIAMKHLPTRTAEREWDRLRVRSVL